jgi:hypothetical protein
LVGENEGKSQLGDQGIDKRIIIKWIFNDRLGGREVHSPDSRHIKAATSSRHAKEFFGSIKCKKFIEFSY